ncbi:hypothetical protein RRG08_053388 [Elysia crispata]|uniref:Uncharacterized protein n=1 Tax=Elysia crispata TaxID=231223 RepID=A0AAE1EAN4_9GAST|nr:hypothetical protein RRG08_053388 [Elysia crispata]
MGGEIVCLELQPEYESDSHLLDGGERELEQANDFTEMESQNDFVSTQQNDGFEDPNMHMLIQLARAFAAGTSDYTDDDAQYCSSVSGCQTYKDFTMMPIERHLWLSELF